MFKKKPLLTIQDLEKMAECKCDHRFETKDNYDGKVEFRCVKCGLYKSINFKLENPKVEDRFPLTADNDRSLSGEQMKYAIAAQMQSFKGLTSSLGNLAANTINPKSE